MPSSATPKTVKLSVLFDSSAGGIAAVSKPSDYRPAKAGDEPVVTAVLTAGPGQSVIEVEVPADLASLDGSELISGLAKHDSVRTLIASIPTAGEASFDEQNVGYSQGLSTGIVTAGQQL